MVALGERNLKYTCNHTRHPAPPHRPAEEVHGPPRTAAKGSHTNCNVQLERDGSVKTDIYKGLKKKSPDP